MEIRDDELDLYSLQHHGVKDQKWGVTHGPPYPLDRNAARQARKAAKLKAKEARKAEKRKIKERLVTYDQLNEKQKKYIDSLNKYGMSWGPTRLGGRKYDPVGLDKRMKEQQQKQRARALEKARETKARKKEEARQEAERAAKEQKKKEKILKGSPEKVYRNRGMFTREDIQSTLDRFDWEQKLQTYSANRLSTTANKAASIVKLMTTAVGGYNTVAATYNAWFPDDSQLPQINLNPVAKKDDKKGKK